MSYGHNKTTKKQKAWDVKEPKLLEDGNSKGRVDLRVEDFDVLLEQKGVNFRVYRTMYCPNVKSVDGGEHEIDCQLCNGSGYVDLNPITSKGFIQNQDLERMMDGLGGQHDGNSVLITFPIGVELQYFTKIEMCDFTQLYFQRVLRKPGTNVDVLKYKACRVNQVMDRQGVQYFQDQDFKLDANGNMLWLTRKPADNVPYSIHYECHITYRTVNAMHVSRFTQYKAPGEPKVAHIKLPEQWLCTKEFLLRRKDINTMEDIQEGPFDNHTNTTGDND
jgi:hypothetical protein